LHDFFDYAQTTSKKWTKREKLLMEIEAVDH